MGDYYYNDFDDFEFFNKKIGKKKKNKDKKKKKVWDKNNACYINPDRDHSKYDYSDFNYDGDFLGLMRKIADSIESYIDYMETYAIYEGVTESEWNKNIKIANKLIKKLRKGDPSVFNVEALNDILSSDHHLIMNI